MAPGGKGERGGGQLGAPSCVLTHICSGRSEIKVQLYRFHSTQDPIPTAGVKDLNAFITSKAQAADVCPPRRQDPRK